MFKFIRDQIFKRQNNQQSPEQEHRITKMSYIEDPKTGALEVRAELKNGHMVIVSSEGRGVATSFELSKEQLPQVLRNVHMNLEKEFEKRKLNGKITPDSKAESAFASVLESVQRESAARMHIGVSENTRERPTDLPSISM